MAGTVPTTESARATTTRELATAGRAQRGPLLPILHAVMAEHGWVSDEDMAVIADVLNLSRADVHGVVSFYHDFRRTPPPAHRVQVCRGEACQALRRDAGHRRFLRLNSIAGTMPAHSECRNRHCHGMVNGGLQRCLANGLSPLRRLKRIGTPGRSKAWRRLLIR